MAPGADPGAMPGAGWVDVPGAPLSPYCSAVRLVDGRAVTSTDCAPEAMSLTFGTGPVGQSSTEVVDAQPLAHEPRLVALELSPAAGDAIRPGASAKMLSDESEVDGERVVGLSIGFAPRGEPSETWTWSGTLEERDGSLEVVLDENDGTEGAPNCHGDNGAGVFTEDGDLVGIVVAAGGSSDVGCVERLILARPLAPAPKK